MAHSHVAREDGCTHLMQQVGLHILGTVTREHCCTDPGDWVGLGVDDGVGEGEGDGVGDGVGDRVGLGVGDGVGEGEGDGVGDGVGDRVGLGVGDGVGEGEGDGVGDGVGVAVGFGVGFLVVGAVVGALLAAQQMIQPLWFTEKSLCQLKLEPTLTALSLGPVLP